jgi:hypothetical protein
METILYIIIQILIAFFVIIGIIAFIFPIKLSLSLPKSGVLLGIVHVYSDPKEDIKYVFFQIHLILISIGVFIQTTPQK